MNNLMNYKGFSAKAEYSADDEIFVGRIIGIDDIVMFHGENVSELKKAFEDAVDFHIEVCEKTGKPVKKHYSGKVFLRVSPELHAEIAEAAESEGKSLNEFGIGVLAEAIAKNRMRKVFVACDMGSATQLASGLTPLFHSTLEEKQEYMRSLSGLNPIRRLFNPQPFDILGIRMNKGK